MAVTNFVVVYTSLSIVIEDCNTLLDRNLFFFTSRVGPNRESNSPTHSGNSTQFKRVNCLVSSKLSTS